MASGNPAFSRNPAFNGKGAQTTTEPVSLDQLNDLYAAPPASSRETGRMTYDDTIRKTLLMFVVLLAAAGVAWFVPALTFPGAIAAFVLGLVNAFKRKPSVPLIMGFAVAEGFFVGGLSSIFEQIWPGTVTQALIATGVTFAVVLALFASGKVRATPKATKIFLVAMIAYAVFSLVNVGLMLFGGAAASGAFGLRSASINIMGFSIPLGVLIGILVVVMASYSLVLDFEFIKRGVESRQDRSFGWYAAYGLVSTIVWLYVEFLRIFALLASNR